MGNYEKVAHSKKRHYGNFSQASLQKAIVAVKGGMALRVAEAEFGVPKSTINRKVRGLQRKPQGGQTSFSVEEEEMFVNHLIQLGEWGFPFSSLDLRITVKNYLERSCRVIKKFTNNTPGEEWARNFLKRHSHKIRQRACQWRKILKIWKLKNPGKTSLLKDEFPILLKELCECLNCENLTAGFSASGIYPFCPDILYKKLPSAAADKSINSVSDAFLDHLKSLRSPNEKSKRCQKRKRLNVEAGKSVSHEDLELSDEEDENKEKSWRKEENEKSGAEEEELNNDIEQDAASTSTTCMKEMKYEEIKVGQWVKVIYEEETFIGKVVEKKNGESRVQCLQKPFGIKMPQQMERDEEAIFYEHVFFCKCRPKLQKFGRCWKYIY